MKQTLTIAYLYPAEMNIYGDRGNVIALQERCRWRGIETKLDEIHQGQEYDWPKADIVFGGGGQDKGQELVADDLRRHQAGLQRAADGGVPMLLVCGLYQLFGHHFTTVEGRRLEGIGVIDAETVGGTSRMIGNIQIKSQFGQLIGFENHSGQTKLGDQAEPLGQVLKGSGNDGRSGAEGATYHNVIGTYLHGPILPKNPHLADHLILTALKHKYGDHASLKPLDDSLELMAATAAASRPR